MPCPHYFKALMIKVLKGLDFLVWGIYRTEVEIHTDGENLECAETCSLNTLKRGDGLERLLCETSVRSVFKDKRRGFELILERSQEVPR